MKRVTTLLIAALVVIALFATIAAARGDFCTECNNGEVRLLRTDGPRYRYYTKACMHGHVGVRDSVKEEYYIYYYGCNNCDYSFTVESTTNITVTCPQGQPPLN